MTTIGESSFQSSGIESLTLRGRITSMGDSAFANCNDLVNLTVSGGVSVIGNSAFYGCGSLERVIISETVTRIGNDSFSWCNALETIYYQGNHSFPSSYFNSSGSLMNVCVPPGYPYETEFGADANVTRGTSVCDEFESKFSQCYKGTYDEDEERVIAEKWWEVSEWESHTNGCTEFYCTEGGGLMYDLKCVSDEEVSRICVEGECVEGKQGVDQKTIIEVELEEGIRVSEMSVDGLKEELSQLTGIDAREFGVGWEVDEEGSVIRVLLYFDDPSVAENISNTLNKYYLNKDNCSKGHEIFCRMKSSHVVSEQSLSGTARFQCVAVFLATGIIFGMLKMSNSL